MTRFKYLPLSKVKKFIKLAKERGVSKVARGEVQSKQTDLGFIEAYKKVNGSISKMKSFPVKRTNPDGQTWNERREAFVARHLTQMRRNNIPLFEKSGKYKGTPTRQHLALIMWAYSPSSKV